MEQNKLQDTREWRQPSFPHCTCDPTVNSILPWDEAISPALTMWFSKGRDNSFAPILCLSGHCTNVSFLQGICLCLGEREELNFKRSTMKTTSRNYSPIFYALWDSAPSLLNSPDLNQMKTTRHSKLCLTFLCSPRYWLVSQNMKL